jgi:hypothetical protein
MRAGVNAGQQGVRTRRGIGNLGGHQGLHRSQRFSASGSLPSDLESVISDTFEARRRSEFA